MATKIKKISVTNLKALSSATMDFNGCTAIVTGGNNKGKSSFIRALMDRMKGIKSPLVLKQGEKNGSYEMELTNGEKITWTFDAKGKEKMTFFTDRNIKTSVTREISQTYFPKVFDVDRFLTDEPGKQKTAIEKIAGIDFTELNRLYAAAYEERTFANRTMKEAEIKRIQFEPHWNQTQEQSTEKLEQEISSIEVKALRYKTIQDGKKQKETQLEKNKKEIIELKKKIEELEEADMQLETDIDKGKIWLDEDKNKPITTEKIVELKEKLKDIKDNNEAVKKENEYEKALKEVTDAEKEVQRIQNDKLDAIKNSSLPEGFSFIGDTVAYNGIPFDRNHLSSSGIYIAALKLATIGLGEVKTLHFDASFLDKNSLKEIEDWATKNNLQLLIERPDFEGGEIVYEIVEE